jgi:lipopolysaccharide transport system ATP-binding protein
MARIELNNLSITFNTRQQKRVSLKEYLVSGLWGKSRNPTVQIRAIDGISLTVHEGERVGVVGHNGAGKSTLLKTLAGIYPPTGGTCRVEGKICSMFDIYVGFEFEATGWDNIRFRAYLQGETPASIADKVEKIAEFSELGEFLHVPVRNYSAGMLMRLAFAIATAIDPEVLLIDEVLAVGDLGFMQKAKGRMSELMDSARLMVMVGHDIIAIGEMCTRVVWMEHGKIRMDGAPKPVLEAYIAAFHAEQAAAKMAADRRAAEELAATLAKSAAA